VSITSKQNVSPYDKRNIDAFITPENDLHSAACTLTRQQSLPEAGLTVRFVIRTDQYLLTQNNSKNNTLKFDTPHAEKTFLRSYLQLVKKIYV
jgi:hypothetical protein